MKGYGIQYITIYKYNKLNLFGREHTLAKNKTGGFALCFLMAASFLISNFFQLWGGDIVLMHVSNYHIHCKKRLAVFPSPAGMSPTKLSRWPGIMTSPLETGKSVNLLLQCVVSVVIEVFHARQGLS
jgi:hypothetical protein